MGRKQEQVSKQDVKTSSSSVAEKRDEEEEIETIHQTVRADIANTWWPQNP